jgi:hypothetical protein
MPPAHTKDELLALLDRQVFQITRARNDARRRSVGNSATRAPHAKTRSNAFHPAERIAAVYQEEIIPRSRVPRMRGSETLGCRPWQMR